MASSLNEVGDALKEAYPAATHVRKETVKVERLDDFFTSRKIVLQPKVLLKADVQGAEHRVLNGAVETLKSVSIILLEASFVELYKGQLLFDGLYDILRAHGFRFGGSQKTEVSPKTGMPIWRTASLRDKGANSDMRRRYRARGIRHPRPWRVVSGSLNFTSRVDAQESGRSARRKTFRRWAAETSRNMGRRRCPSRRQRRAGTREQPAAEEATPTSRRQKRRPGW